MKKKDFEAMIESGFTAEATLNNNTVAEIDDCIFELCGDGDDAPKNNKQKIKYLAKYFVDIYKTLAHNGARKRATASLEIMEDRDK